MALAQGSGELIWWPYIVAKYGLTFLCLLIPACLLQYPLNVEIGSHRRYVWVRSDLAHFKKVKDAVEISIPKLTEMAIEQLAFEEDINIALDSELFWTSPAAADGL